eukprot:1043284-Alexandrium_andersonii.AAC.1
MEGLADQRGNEVASQMEQLVGQSICAGGRPVGSRHSHANAGQAGFGLVELGHSPAAVRSEEGAGGLSGSPARLPNSLPAVPQHLERLTRVSGDPAGEVTRFVEGALGLQPRAPPPKVFGRLPGSQRLAQCSL